VVNETFARKFFPNQDPIGKRLGISDARHGGDYEIVGVAEDAKFTSSKKLAVPMFFMPLLQIETYKDPDDQAYQIWANYIDSIHFAHSEIGIDIRHRKLVLRGAMQPIAVGLLVGVPVALAGGHAIASQLFGVKVYDPLVLAGAVTVLAAAAVLAAILPARRAASIDPIRALRTE
jgi:hypothetical protein